MRILPWLNENRYRVYPFIEDSLLEADGQAVPNDVYLDFQAVNFIDAESKLYWVSFSVAHVGPVANITFSLQYEGGLFFSFLVPDSSGFPFQASVSDGTHRATALFGEGVKTLGLLADDTYTFTAPGVEVEPALLSFQDKHRVVSVQGLDSPSEVLSGDIYLKEGYNAVIALDAARNLITLGAALGSGEPVPCTPVDPLPNPTECIDSVFYWNGLRPNNLGEFLLLAGAGVQITTDPENHQIFVQTTIDPARPECRDEV